MKLQPVLLALVLLLPVGAAPQGVTIPHSSGLPPDLVPGALVARLAPADLQSLLVSESALHRVERIEGRWLKLVPVEPAPHELAHAAWIDSAVLEGYVVVEEAGPRVLQATEQRELEACKGNFAALAQGILEYRAKYGLLPKGSGAGFLTALITDKVWASSAENARRLTCPAVSYDELAGLRGKHPTEWFADPTVIDESYTAYWGRDTQRHPLRKFPASGKEVLAACNHHPDEWGGQTTVVLYGDMTVRTLRDRDLQRDGRLRGRERLTLGPGSQLEGLRKLAPK